MSSSEEVTTMGAAATVPVVAKAAKTPSDKQRAVVAASAGAADDSGKKQQTKSVGQRRKDMFGDCALVEIIHLHDCLRGALTALEKDVGELSGMILEGKQGQDTHQLSELERRVAGRFKVIWSVFRAHSSAEDEFIWPTLQSKTQGRIKGSPKYNPTDNNVAQDQQQQDPVQDVIGEASVSAALTSDDPARKATSVDSCDEGIEQEEYEEDHVNEERMFSFMDDLLTKLREGLVQQKRQSMSLGNGEEEGTRSSSSSTTTNTPASAEDVQKSIHRVMKELYEQTQLLSQHLFSHLAKEEKQCLPLVVKHLSKDEIHDLVGKIMGKRSSDMISEIMTMAVQNLNDTEREEMVKYMKQAMAGTFFDRWLLMSGWMKDSSSSSGNNKNEKRPAVAASTTPDNNDNDNNNKRIKTEEGIGSAEASTPAVAVAVASAAADGGGGTAAASMPVSISQTLPFLSSVVSNPAGGVTSQAELEKLIRAIATNPNLTPLQKNTTIQGLRDSVWKSNQRLKASSEQNLAAMDASASTVATAVVAESVTHATHAAAVALAAATNPASNRLTPPAFYYRKNSAGKLSRVWGSNVPGERCANDGTVPFFSASELAPTYHDGATGAVLGCPHYSRNCKLRHPESGRLYTCRLCCEQEREMPNKDQDEPLDRYAVKEVMCMKCNTLQPAEDRCVNTACESGGQPFAKYFCKICHLYDDRPDRPIYHCPYCNTCRMGLGLGIDFRHCMRCNACVSLADDNHQCIPQKLQGSCPICHDTLFQSTEPLRGLQCGHVMHLSCFMEYRRSQRYTCPLCMRCMEDMSDYFALLDAAVRMQPMPHAYLNTFSNVYCQDCEKTGQCRYHFVGQKCPNCGSYNTREMGRVQG